jgi:import receptor subunit TOM20
MALPAPEDDPLNSVYCSRECEAKARAQYRTLLFAPGSALPAELAEEAPQGIDAARHAAQARFAAYLANAAGGRTIPHLVARFIGRQVGTETAKMLPGGGPSEYGADLPTADDAQGMDYTLHDHIERMRFLDVVVPSDEQEMMRDLLQTALPGLVGNPS